MFISEHPNRWLIRQVAAAIPHLIILHSRAAMGIVTFIAFRDSVHQALSGELVQVRRWCAAVSNNVGAYVYFAPRRVSAVLRCGQYPVAFEVDQPAELNQLIFSLAAVIPNAIVYLVVALAALLVTIVAWFAILFTGKYPRGISILLSGRCGGCA
jgi:hypothetical protein